MAEVFLFGNLRASLTLARSLARAGHVVHAGVDDLDPFIFRSRYVRGSVRHAPPDREPERCLAELLDYLERHPGISALAPVSEVATRLLSRHRDRLPPRVRLIAPEERLVEACADKASLFALCDRLGLPIAPRALAGDLQTLRRVVAEVGLPCIVKPVESTGWVLGEKAVVLRTAADLARLAAWPEGHRTLCAQRWVEGPRHNVYFGAAGGQLLGAVEVEILRTDRANGVGYAVEGVSVTPLPEVRRMTEALVRALDYTGVGCIQVMVDDAGGGISFLEVNARLGANYKIAEICGLPLSLWLYELASGETPIARNDPWRYPVGRRYAHCKGDLGGLKNEWRRGAVTPRAGLRWAMAAARAVLRRDHLTFCWDDPAPTVWLYLHKVLARLGVDPWPRGLRRPPGYAAGPMPTAQGSSPSTLTSSRCPGETAPTPAGVPV